MTAYVGYSSQGDNPLVDYAIKNMWGHPELDVQHQLKLGRISPKAGFINDFFYMGKSYALPLEGVFYHVFSMGGLNIDFWNMGNRKLNWDPYNTWTKASVISNERGVVLDVYNGKGYLFPRTKTYILNTFEGQTFVAFPVTNVFPIPADAGMYIRCYSSDINIDVIEADQQIKYRFGYEGVVYNQPGDFTVLKQRYDMYKAFGLGRVVFIRNGIIVPIDSYVPNPGDYIEVVYDPTIKRVETYNYLSLNDYYSEMDSKRKLLIFPGIINKPHKYNYFDDCDFYVRNRRTGQGFYYHRNSADAIRQLTHQDFGLAAPYVEFLVAQLISLDTTKKSSEDDIEIQVCYRETKWTFDLGPTSSRIKDLYLLEDPAKILMAMIGSKATIPEWTPGELERSPVNKVLNSLVHEISTETVRDALGYNGCSVALSSSPFYMPGVAPGDPGFVDRYPTPPYTAGLGYKVPPTYIVSSTAYEYSEEGLLLRATPILNREWFTPSQDTWYVEYVLGKASNWLDYEISRQDVVARKGYGFRVYKAGWLIDPTDPSIPDRGLFDKEFAVTTDGRDIYPEPTEVRIYGNNEATWPDPIGNVSNGRPDGNWVDITDTDEYTIKNGVISWNFDVNNYVGMVVFDGTHLFNEFDLTHIDNSIWFAVTHMWDIGGVPLRLEPGQVDIWCNGHPLIENVDYVLDFPSVYITTKMWLSDTGTNRFAYRARGLSKDGIIPSSELGFVCDGVLGYTGRYNLRIDRPTRTIINGRLWLTDAIDWAENIDHGANAGALNGFPYEVKHIYCDNKYVEDYDLHWGFKESRELDKRVSDYLTEYVGYKPPVPLIPPYLEADKYRLFSPFLSQLINEMVLGFLVVPKPEETGIRYSDQAIDDITRNYQWLLKYDPVLLGHDLRFFTVQPYPNPNRITVTPDQLTIISRANDLYLNGKVKLEGHFEVTHV